jgi:hypothetical protein
MWLIVLILLALVSPAHAQIIGPSSGTPGPQGPPGPAGPASFPLTGNVQGAGYSINNFAAPLTEANSNLNPKFHGASGSAQTASCTGSTGSSNQVTCSGGTADFAVGESIKIIHAGNSPSVSPPTGLSVTPTCTGTSCVTNGQFSITSIAGNGTTATVTFAGGPYPSHIIPGSSFIISGNSQSGFNGTFNVLASFDSSNNQTVVNPVTMTFASATNATGTGGTFTQTHTYNYCVMAADALGNAALSACSSTATVTSIGELYPQIQGGTGTALENALSWTVSSGGTGYIVCRGEDTSTMTPWYTLGGGASSLADWGINQVGYKFTPASFGYPATCSSGSGQRNDVYGLITGIAGNVITFSANGVQPTNHAGTPYPSTIQVNGTFTVEHDDTPAFRIVENLVRNASNGSPLKIEIPAGNYNLNLSQLDNSEAFTGYLDLSGFNNVDIAGDSAGGTILNVRGTVSNFSNSATAVFTALGDSGAGRYSYNDCSDKTCYNVTDPVLLGQSQLTMAASDAANLTVGHWVWIGVPSGGAAFGELNQILTLTTQGSVSTLTLRWPFSHYYSATRYYGTPPYSSGCQFDQCLGQPYITDVNSLLSSQHIAIHDLSVTGAARVTDPNQSYDWHIYNVKLDPVLTFGQSGLNREMEYGPGIKLLQDSATDQELGPVAAASDNTINTHDSSFISIDGAAAQSCEEGAVHINAVNNIFSVSGPLPSDQNILWGGGSCFDAHVIGNTFRIANTNLNAILGGLSNLIEIEASDNYFFADNIASGKLMVTPDNPVLIQLTDNHANSTLTKFGANANYQYDTTPGTEEGWQTAVGGLSLLGGASVASLPDPIAPSIGLCHGTTGTGTSYGPYYAQFFTNTGNHSALIGPFSTTNGPTTLSNTSCLIIQSGPQQGYTSYSIYKGDTTHILPDPVTGLTVLPVVGSVSAGYVFSGSILHDIGQATVSVSAPNTANDTGGLFAPLILESGLQLGYSGTASLSPNPSFTLSSDYVGAPFQSRIWTPTTMKTCLEVNSNPNINVGTFNTWDTCLDANLNQLNWWYTPKGQVAPDIEEMAMNSSGVMVLEGPNPGLILQNAGAVTWGHSTFANLGANLATNGEEIFCTNCNNVVTDGATAGAACSATSPANPGTGALALRISSGVYQCN